MTRYPLCRKDGAGSLHKPNPTTQRGVKKATAFCERASMAYYTHYLLLRSLSLELKVFSSFKGHFLIDGSVTAGRRSKSRQKKLLQFNFLSTIFFLDEIPRCTESAVEICRSAAQVEIRTRDFPDLTFEPATCPLVTRCTCYHCLTVVHCYHYCFSHFYYDHYLSVSALSIIADSFFIVAFVFIDSSWPYNLHLTLIIISHNLQKNSKISTFSQNFKKTKKSG